MKGVTARGAILRGERLIKALGFANATAFQRARRAGQIGVALYPIPGQSRGVYAFEGEVKEYLANRPVEPGAQQK